MTKRLPPNPNYDLWMTRFIYRILRRIPTMSLVKQQDYEMRIYRLGLRLTALDEDYRKFVRAIPMPTYRAEHGRYYESDEPVKCVYSKIEFEPMKIVSTIDPLESDNQHDLNSYTQYVLHKQCMALGHAAGTNLGNEMYKHTLKQHGLKEDWKV